MRQQLHEAGSVYLATLEYDHNKSYGHIIDNLPSPRGSTGRKRTPCMRMGRCCNFLQTSRQYIQQKLGLAGDIQVTDLIHKSHNVHVPYHAPIRTEMCTYLFWLVHCGIWKRCIVGFVKLVYCKGFVTPCSHQNKIISKPIIWSGLSTYIKYVIQWYLASCNQWLFAEIGNQNNCSYLNQLYVGQWNRFLDVYNCCHK